MDRGRIVKPPTFAAITAIPFYWLAHAIFFWNWYAATAVFCGGFSGYVHFEILHYFLHHRSYVVPVAPLLDQFLVKACADVRRQVTKGLPGNQKVSSTTSLLGLRERLWCNNKLFRLHFRNVAEGPN